MNYTLLRIMKSIKEAQQAAHNRLTKQQLVAVLQGITGFASAIFTSKVSEDPVGPFDYIDTALDIVDYDINKPCLVALDSVISSAKKWLTFGQYRPLEDSSDLNFDLIDVSSVTDIMQVWLIFFIYLFTRSFVRPSARPFIDLAMHPFVFPLYSHPPETNSPFSPVM